MSTLAPHTLVHDRYRVVRIIGRGGFGAVYEAVDVRLNKRVALKQLLLEGENISRQFQRQAQLLANLDHPSLPGVSDHFADASGQFLVMDFVAGDDLATRLHNQRGPFPLVQVLEWGLQLLAVLQYLHGHRPPIIHRDIKPANLKVLPEGLLMLLDFDIAKGYVGEAPATADPRSIMAMTEGYAAPEQAEGRGTDERTDLYGVAATLYVLLTNVSLTKAELRMLAAERKQPDPVRPPRHHNPQVPWEVSRLLMSALALDPAERPQSAQLMSMNLQAAVSAARAAAPLPQPFLPRPVAPDVPPAESPPTILDLPNAQPPAGMPRADEPPTVLDAAPSTAPPRDVRRDEQLAVLYAEARRYHQAKDWRVVVAIFERIRKLDKYFRDDQRLLSDALDALAEEQRELHALYKMGVAYAGTQSWEEAVRCFETVERRAPGYRDTREWLRQLRATTAEPLDKRRRLTLWSTVAACCLALLVVMFIAVAVAQPDPNGANASPADPATLPPATATSSTQSTTAPASMSTAPATPELTTAPVSLSPVRTAPASALTPATPPPVVNPLLATLRSAAPVSSIAFSPDSQTLASALYDKTITLWQVSGGAALRTLSGHADVIADLVFAPDGQILASASNDMTVKLWRVSDGAELRTFVGHTTAVDKVVFSADAQVLASAALDGSVKLWRVSDGVELHSLPARANVKDVAISPDRQIVAGALHDGTLKLWQVSDGEELRTLAGHSEAATAAAFSPDGRILASASYDKTVRLWRVSDGAELLTIAGHDGWVGSLAFTDDGETIASSALDRTVKLWRVSDGSALLTLYQQSDPVTSLVFSPDGQIIALAAGDTLNLWRVGAGPAQ